MKRWSWEYYVRQILAVDQSIGCALKLIRRVGIQKKLLKLIYAGLTLPVDKHKSIIQVFNRKSIGYSSESDGVSTWRTRGGGSANDIRRSMKFDHNFNSALDPGPQQTGPAHNLNPRSRRRLRVGAAGRRRASGRTLKHAQLKPDPAPAETRTVGLGATVSTMRRLQRTQRRLAGGWAGAWTGGPAGGPSPPRGGPGPGGSDADRTACGQTGSPPA